MLTIAERCRWAEVAQSVLDVYLTLPEHKGTGGYFTIRQGELHEMLLCTSLGEVLIDKQVKYMILSLEKGERLGVYSSTHVGSYQSRDPEQRIIGQSDFGDPWGKWGGAIRAKDFILSFSGLPERADEAVMMVTAIKLGLMEFEDGMMMSQALGVNPFFQDLFYAVERAA